MTILFCGGGTMGPVTPLIAVLRRMREMRPDLRFAWAGTPDGPERAVVEAEGVPFYPIPVAKLARYPNVRWITWPLDYLKASREARRVVSAVRPSLVVSAGGFTSVPVIARAARRGTRCAIHQLDVEPGLSNKAVARRCASVTTSFPYGNAPFPGVKTERVATPCRFAGVRVPTKIEAAKALGLDPDHPAILIVGGGTGAAAINEAVWSVLDDNLDLAHIIHLTGKGKSKRMHERQGYVMKDFLDEREMLNAYAAADVVVSRAGMGGLSDLACLKKAAIIVPIPGSHQERNAERMPYPIVPQGESFGERLLKETKRLLADADLRASLGERAHAALPTDDGTELATAWLALLG